MIDFLVVEDDPKKYSDIEKFIKSIREDFFIKHVDSVSEAILEIKSRQFSFVFVDIQLPNESGQSSDINSNAGIELVKWIKHNQKRGKCLPPDNILILSQYKNLIDSHDLEMLKTRVFSYLYESQSNDWKESIKECVEEFLLKSEVNMEKVKDELIVYSVHGINTNGEWQEFFGDYISNQTDLNVQHSSYKYQYYPILHFLWPPLRESEVNRMIKELKFCARKAPNSTVHLVGHSFGTYVICEALNRIGKESAPKIGNLVLVNSVLKSGYDFTNIAQKHEINTILNECAINDKVLIMSQIFALRLGMAGRMGFKGNLYTTIKNRFFKGGHSDLFVKERFSDWLEVIKGNAVSCVDERDTVDSITALKHTFFIVTPYILGAFIISGMFKVIMNFV
ncbi:alpha/beta hydrolase [Shewanella sp. 0m-8]